MLPSVDKAGSSFDARLAGTLGQFRTAGVPMDYILTKATLTLTAGSSLEQSSLAKHLRLMREVLDVKHLAFEQLLQRDLDDDRVARRLIPYLLSGKQDAPAFFPPVLAVLLPIRGAGGEFAEPGDRYPERATPKFVKENGQFWEEIAFGGTMRVRRQVQDESAGEMELSAGQLEWNTSESALLVLDGQHRTMALLAIHRYLTNSWPTASMRFKAFYEDVLLEADLDGRLARAREVGWRVELPITVCWPAPQPGQIGPTPLAAARKLFVDLNQNARRMGRGRTLLLADTALVGEMLRAFLEDARGEKPTLPICAIDYEEQTVDTNKYSKRWSCLTTLKHLELMFILATSGSARVVADVGGSFTMAVAPDKKLARIKQTLRAVELARGAEIASLQLEEIAAGNSETVLEVVCHDSDFRKRLGRQFADTWGRAIAILLSEVVPLDAHLRSLEWLRDEVATSPELSDDVVAAAREALFDGAGLFYVLQNANKQRSSTRAANPGTPHRRTGVAAVVDRKDSQVGHVWDKLSSLRTLFQNHYSLELSGEEVHAQSEMLVKDRNLRDVSYTYAFQLGLTLTLTLLQHHLECALAELPRLARWMSSTLTQSLAGEIDGKMPRRWLLLDRDSSHNPLNLMKQLEVASAANFRYLWLEILAHAPDDCYEGRNERGYQAKIEALADRARQTYREQMIKEREREIKQLKGSEYVKDNAKEAAKVVDSDLQRGLEYWFGWPERRYYSWRDKALNKRKDDED